MFKTLVLVFLGGGIGSVLRFSLSLLAMRSLPAQLIPVGTLASNVLATALLGALVAAGWSATRPENLAGYALLAIGFCGGLSTFSTFSLETFQLIRTGELGWALANMLINMTLCIILLFVIIPKK